MKFVLAGLVLFASVSAFCDVKFAPPFSDGMVLQRERSVLVWGTSSPDEKVKVTFRDRNYEVVADKTGKWRVSIDTGSACSDPLVLQANDMRVSDVLVGEVWFASGQSNMECPIWGGNVRYRDGKGSMMVAMTREPKIRFVKMAHKWSATPKIDSKVTWHRFMPEDFAKINNQLSSVAFYYARELHNALDIPIGIVDASWGGTNIDAWTPRSAYESHPELKDVAAFPVTGQWNDSMKKGVINGAQQQPTVLWNGMLATWAGYGCRGFIWYQGCNNNGEASRYCDKMHALYDGWVKEFSNPNLKLYFALLAPYKINWFDLQLSQLKFASEEKNASLAVLSDNGNLDDIHPNGKEIVAKRLVIHALKQDYGFSEIQDESPTLVDWKIDGGKVALTFSNAKSLYVYNPNRSLQCGFDIVTSNGKSHPAEIVKNEGNRLVISAKGVTNDIMRVSYLRNAPYFGALYSDAALPVAPFDIDMTYRYLPKLLDREMPDTTGMRKIYSIDLPVAPGFAGKRPRYGFDDSAKAGEFSRVGYLYELERAKGGKEWIYTEFDSPTKDVNELGIPSEASGRKFQQRVSNLVVVSNVEGVDLRKDYDGGMIEFFPDNYQVATAVAGVGGDSKTYDFNDTITPSKNGAAGYGSMQVHDWKSGKVLWALNCFNGGTADCGIGCNRFGEHMDWTFMRNAASYSSRKLTVYVR